MGFPAEVVDGLAPGTLPPAFSTAMQESLRNAAEGGGLYGYPVTGVRITLVEAVYDDVGQPEIALNSAGSLAFREALREAGATVLEPYGRLELRLPEDYLGSVVKTLNQRRAAIEETGFGRNAMLVKGVVPIGEMFGYLTVLRSNTQGRGSFSLEPLDYRPLPDQLVALHHERQYHWGMVSPLLLLPLLCGLVTERQDADPCDLVVRVEEQDGAPAPPGLWVRAQQVGGSAVAEPLQAGVASLRTRCGAYRVEVGSPQRNPAELRRPRTEMWVHPITATSTVIRLGEPSDVRLFLPPTALVDLEVTAPDGSGRAGFVLDVRAPDRRTGFSLVSDRSGRAEARAAIGPYELFWLQPHVRELRAAGRPAPRAQWFDASLPAGGLLVTVALEEAAAVSGTIRSATGKALPGVEVRGVEASPAVRWSARTDPDGKFSEPLVRGPVTLEPLDPTRKWRFDPAAASCDRTPCEVGFTASPLGAERLRLRVLSDDDGAPLSGAAFATHPTCPSDAENGITGVTGPDGRVVMPCPAACPIFVQVRKHGWLPHRVRFAPAACQGEHEVRLTRGAVLQGRVVDGEGRPVPALPIRASTGGVVFTDAQGRFQLTGLAPGRVRVELDSGHGPSDGRALARCAPECAAPLLSVPSGEDGGVDLRLVPGGRICVGAEAPGPGGVATRSCLRAYPRGEEWAALEVEGVWGRASVCSEPLPPGEYDVRVDCPVHERDPESAELLPVERVATWVPGADRRGDAGAVTVRAGETVHLGAVALRTGGRLEIDVDERARRDPAVATALRVLQGNPSASSDKPVLEVRPAADETRTWRRAGAVEVERPHRDLRLRARDLPSGSWWLRLTFPGGARLETEVPLDVGAGQEGRATFGVPAPRLDSPRPAS
jgi:hypothetical protein